MPNSKISALTSATTPLAGTEVLPIVQSSTTVKVATDDLTVKNVRSNATTGILQIAGPGAGTTRTMTTPNANFTAARTDAAQTFTGVQSFSGQVAITGGFSTHSANSLNGYVSSSEGRWQVEGPDTSTWGTFGLYLSRSDGTGLYGVFTANTSGMTVGDNITTTSGNFKFGTSGKGIFDTNGNESLLFTATASAVNELTIANAATGNRPTISATGGDTNISINLTPKGTGDVNVTTGNLVIGTAGKGIDFSANSHAAGMTSELLDWYETGTWTGGVSFGNATTGITYSNTLGYYTRVGNIVTVSAYINLSNKGSATGSARITGLPFTCANNAAAYSAPGLFFTNLTFSGQVVAYVNINATTIDILQTTEAGTNSALTNTNFTNTTAFIINLSYRAA